MHLPWLTDALIFNRDVAPGQVKSSLSLWEKMDNYLEKLDWLQTVETEGGGEAKKHFPNVFTVKKSQPMELYELITGVANTSPSCHGWLEEHATSRWKNTWLNNNKKKMDSKIVFPSTVFCFRESV